MRSAPGRATATPSDEATEPVLSALLGHGLRGDSADCSLPNFAGSASAYRQTSRSNAPAAALLPVAPLEIAPSGGGGGLHGPPRIPGRRRRSANLLPGLRQARVRALADPPRLDVDTPRELLETGYPLAPRPRPPPRKERARVPRQAGNVPGGQGAAMSFGPGRCPTFRDQPRGHTERGAKWVNGRSRSAPSI
jgi:hypothetical protein